MLMPMTMTVIRTGHNEDVLLGPQNIGQTRCRACHAARPKLRRTREKNDELRFHIKPSTFHFNDINSEFICGERYVFAAFAIKYTYGIYVATHEHDTHTRA